MSKRFYITFLCVLLTCPALWSCQNAPDPQLVLQEATLAHGGKTAIAKPRKGILTGASKADGGGITQEEVFDLPNKWKRTTLGTFLGQKKVAYNMVIGDRYWAWDDDGDIREMKYDGSAEPYLNVVTFLLSIQEEKAKLAPLAPINVDNKPAIGFRVTSESRPTDYYFNKSTHLLNSCTHKGKYQPALTGG